MIRKIKNPQTVLGVRLPLFMFPSLLVKHLYRRFFPHWRMSPEVALRRSLQMSLLYILTASSGVGYLYYRWQMAKVSAGPGEGFKRNDDESTSVWYARRIYGEEAEDDVYSIKRLSIKGTDISHDDVSEEIRRRNATQRPEDYNRYEDENYLRKRLGISKTTEFDKELAAAYCRRIDKSNKEILGSFGRIG